MQIGDLNSDEMVVFWRIEISRSGTDFESRYGTSSSLWEENYDPRNHPENAYSD